jgi:hypothetical protein
VAAPVQIRRTKEERLAELTGRFLHDKISHAAFMEAWKRTLSEDP